MLLQGNLREFSLPNIFQLVKMSAKTGALTIRREEEWGKIFFKDGMIHYAFHVPQTVPIGERLVVGGSITSEQLKQALETQKKSGEGARLGAILLREGLIDRDTLEAAVREQIQDAAFDFFGWPDGEFEFSADEAITDEDILVEMNVENVIMEGCRRIDEWEVIFEKLGSLERIPHLVYSDGVEEQGEINLGKDEWRVIVHVDGRADVNTILRDCGLDRFRGAKVIYSLFSSGLLMVTDPVIESLGVGRSVAVRGPIDIYNEVFLSTLTDANITKQLRVELIDEKEVEVPIVAGNLPSLAVDGEESDGEVLVFTTSASSPDQAWKQLARDSSGFVVLANANDDDSLRATRDDLAFVKELGDPPMVVATYTSMADDAVAEDQVKKVLALGDDVPVMPCSLRDRESVLDVLRRVLELAAG